MSIRKRRCEHCGREFLPDGEGPQTVCSVRCVKAAVRGERRRAYAAERRTRPIRRWA